MSITMDHRLVAARPRPVSGTRHVRRLPQWLEFAGFFLSFLALVIGAMALRFYVYGPAEIWPRLVTLFG